MVIETPFEEASKLLTDYAFPCNDSLAEFETIIRDPLLKRLSFQKRPRNYSNRLEFASEQMRKKALEQLRGI